MRFGVDGHLALLHGVQQRGLRFSRGTVDFIGQQEAGEHRALDQFEFVLLQVEDAGAGDVRGNQIRRALDASEFRAKHLGECSHQEGFAHAWNAFNQHMVACEDGNQGVVDHGLLADDHFGNLGAGCGKGLFQVVEGGGHGGRIGELKSEVSAC